MRTRSLRRALSVVAMAFLLVTAGCSFLAGDDSTPTAGPPETTTEPSTDSPATTTSETPHEVSIAGVEAGRLVDAGSLASAHQQALVTTGFETRLAQNASVVVSTGPNTSQVVGTTIVQQVVAGVDGRPYRYRKSDAAIGLTVQAWGNDSVQVTRSLQGEEVVQTRVRDPEPVDRITSTDALATYLRTGNFSVEGTTTGNGTRLVTLTADELAVENDSNLFVRGSSDYGNYSATVVVDENGVVRSLDLSADYLLRGERRTLGVTYEVVRTGNLRFERPDWATRALTKATQTDEPVGTATTA